LGETANLQGRFHSWRPAITGSAPAKSKTLRETLPQTDLADWEFSVVEEMPDATKGERLAKERQYIERMIANAGVKYTVLNTEKISASVEPPSKAVRATEITYNGDTVTYREAADLLGVELDSLAMRLAKYRKKGFTKVTVEILRTIGPGGKVNKHPGLIALNTPGTPQALA